MAFPLKHCSKPAPFTAASVISQFQAVCGDLPATRQTATSNHLNDTIGEAAMSAFSVGFTPSPSFLDYPVRLPKKYGKNHAQSLFGRHQLPSVSQVRNRLDTVPPETLSPMMAEIREGIFHSGYLTA